MRGKIVKQIDKENFLLETNKEKEKYKRENLFLCSRVYQRRTKLRRNDDGAHFEFVEQPGAPSALVLRETSWVNTSLHLYVTRLTNCATFRNHDDDLELATMLPIDMNAGRTKWVMKIVFRKTVKNINFSVEFLWALLARLWREIDRLRPNSY